MPLLTAGPSRFLGGGNVTWLLRDEFTTDLAAGAVNGTAAEPGPGTRTVVDTGSKLSLASGSAVWSAVTAANDPRITYADIAIKRVKGRIPLGSFDLNSSRFGVGFATVGGGYAVSSGWSDVSGGCNVTDNGIALIYTFSFSLGSVTKVATVLRSAGAFYFAKTNVAAAGLSTNQWLLVWRGETNTTTPLYVTMAARTSSFAPASFVRIPDTLWLPTPLVSDSFATVFGTSDGLGHAEGIATGIGAGGGGVTWTQQVGTWAVGSAKANAATLSGGIAVATVSASTANVVLGVACVRSAGEVGVVLSWADSNNYVRALHNGTNVQLIKTVAGTPTTLINAVVTYSAGARLVVTKDDTKYRVYYNNALVGTEQTIADAGIISNTLHGLFSTDPSNTLDDFVVYARGNEGQYASLDRYSGS